MSCRNFETVITELARGQMTEAGARENALAHMESCKPCAVKHADEQALTAGLRAAAMNIGTAEASARVEEALVFAFRQRAATPSSSTAKPDYRTLPGWATLAIAAAAAFLVVSAFGVSRLLFNGPSESPQREARINQPPTVSSPVATPQNSAPPSTEAPSANSASGPERTLPVNASTSLADRLRPQRFSAVLSSKTRRNAKNYSLAADGREEIATDFLPLTYGGGLSQMDGGQVIRVEVPRSALQSFGLPMNVERAGERVKADVLVGNDGVARAIRFVR